MKKIVSALVLSTALVAVAAAQTTTAPQAPTAAAADQNKTQQSLQGTWLVISFNGQDPSAQGAEMVFLIDKNTYKIAVNGEQIESGTFKVDDTKKPITFDLDIKEGDDAGKWQPGVMEIKGDVVQVGLATPGNTVRPTSFDTAELTAVFRKVK